MKKNSHHRCWHKWALLGLFAIGITFLLYEKYLKAYKILSVIRGNGKNLQKAIALKKQSSP
jgi:hypothetical protein